MKTIYDPCPVGYMVPPAEAMGNLGSCEAEYIEQGAYLTIDGEKVYFPYSGILSQQDSHGYETHDGWYGNYGDTDSATGGWGYSCRLQTSTTVQYSQTWGGAGDRLTPSQLVVGLFPTPPAFFLNNQIVTGFNGGFRAQGASVRCVRIPENE